MTASADDADAAAAWAIRCDGGALAPADQAALDRWLAADERRAGALLRAEAVLAYLDRARALGPGEPEAAAPARFSRRGVLIGGGLAGTAVAAGVAGVLLVPPGEEFATAVGEVRRLPLVDGSTATVNTASRIAVAMKPALREITLERGEAWFQVAHDRARPFVVAAGDVRVRAIGTAFSVRRHADGVDVLVTEGAVETWRTGRDADAVRVASGRRTFVADTDSRILAVPAADEIERALAWRSGGLALNGEPLSYALAELNRYNRRQLVVEDPALGRTPIVGYFRTGEPGNFARSVAALIGARVEEDDRETRLVVNGA